VALMSQSTPWPRETAPWRRGVRCMASTGDLPRSRHYGVSCRARAGLLRLWLLWCPTVVRC
jgi:hypothetical protein